MDHPLVLLQAEMEDLHSKPSERGQHEVMNESRHNCATNGAVQSGHVMVEEKSDVEQEQR